MTDTASDAWAAATAVERHPGWYTGRAQHARAMHLIGDRSGPRRCDMRTPPQGPTRPLLPLCDCDRDPVPGALWPMASDGDSAYPFVERCDDCKRFPDDIAAAEAVAAAVGSVVSYAGVHGDASRLQPYVKRGI